MTDVFYPDLSGNGKGVLDLDSIDQIDTAAGLVPPYSGVIHSPAMYKYVVDLNDSASFRRMGEAIQLASGGIIELITGKTYTVGGQTFQDGSITGYTGEPVLLFKVLALTKPLIINGNGAKVKCASGLKYGQYDSNGTSQVGMPYYGNNRATPYRFMFDIQLCTAFIEVNDLETDGNINAQLIGGQWGDTGWQLPMSGFNLANNSGGITFNNVNNHHHGQDALQYNGPAASESAAMENFVSNNSRYDKCGRLGVALVGGRGLTFNGGSMNWNAASDAPGGGLLVTSNPGAGLDLEAEAGKVVRDIILNDVEMIGNKGTCIVGDNTNVARVTCNRCILIQTHTGAYALWPAIANFRLNGGLVAGTIVNARGDPLKPEEAFFANGTIFTNDNAYSPTGVVGTVNDLFFETPGPLARAENCMFINNRPGGTNSTGIGYAHNCSLITIAGNVSFNAIFSGNTRFVEPTKFTDCFYNFPGGLVSGLGDLGESLDTWSLTLGGVETIYPATIDRASGKQIYYGSTVYDPPSLAAGAKTTIQTMTVTGVALGDKVTEQSFSLNLAGARIVAWVSAADTVSYYVINENGANPLDLGSGTISVKVVKV